MTKTTCSISNTIRPNEQWKWTVEGVFTLGFLIYVFIFSPGFMSDDSAYQLSQARTGFISDWHPPAMALVWAMIEQTGIKGGLGMLVLQSFLIWTGAYLVHRAYFRQGRGRTAAVMFFILFFPPLLGIAGAIWKDNLMWGLLFIVIGGAGFVKTQDGEICRWRNWLLTACLVMFVLGAVLMRHNAIFAAAPLVLFIYCRLYNCARPQRVMLALASAIVTLVLVFALAGFVNNKISDRKDHAWLSIPLFDTVGVLVRLPDHAQRQALYERMPESLRRSENADSLIPVYSPRYWANPILSPNPPVRFNVPFDWVSDLDKDKMKTLWLSLPFEFPGQWMSHRLAVFAHLTGWTNDDLWCPVFMLTNGYSNTLGKQVGWNPERTQLQRIIGWAIYSLQSYWVFRPWFYLMIASLVAGFAMLKFHEKHLAPLLISLSGIAHEVALFFFAPSADYRYSHYLVFCGIMALFFLVAPAIIKWRSAKIAQDNNISADQLL